MKTLITLIFLFGLNLTAFGVDYTPLVENDHIQYVDFDLKPISNELSSRGYNISKERKNQLISKERGFGEEINDYYLEQTKDKNFRTLVEVAIDNYYVGTSANLITTKFNGKNVITRTKCTQGIRGRTYPWSTGKEKINCTTYTSHFCKVLNSEMESDSTVPRGLRSATKKITKKEVTKCVSLLGNVQSRMKSIREKITGFDKLISKNDIKKLKKIGYDRSKKFFRSSGPFYDVIEEFGTSETFGKNIDKLNKGYFGMRYLEDAMIECDKLQKFFKIEEQIQVIVPNSTSSSLPE
jgi:hypothetical protein